MVWLYYIVLIHSSVDDHLGCVYLLAVMSNAAVNIRGRIFSLSFLIGVFLGVQLLGRMVTLFLSFLGTARLFSKAAAPLYIPTSSV